MKVNFFISSYKNPYSFKGTNINPNMEVPSYSDLLSRSKKEISQAIESSIAPKNFIGEGIEAVVYKLENTPYCVKVRKYERHDFNPELNTNLTTEDEFNHVKAKLGYKYVIMDLIEGETLAKYRDDSVNRTKLQSAIAEMPIQSYKELLYQVADAMKKGIIFDCNAGNVVFNTNKQKMTAIDFFRVSNFEQIMMKPLVGMFNVLTSLNPNKKTRQVIEYKILQAGMEELQPEIPAKINVETMGIVELIEKICNKSVQVTKTQTKELIDIIQKLVFFKATNRFARELKTEYPQAEKLMRSVFKM